jgi:hypothetical protein
MPPPYHRFSSDLILIPLRLIVFSERSSVLFTLAGVPVTALSSQPGKISSPAMLELS